MAYGKCTPGPWIFLGDLPEEIEQQGRDEIHAEGYGRICLVDSDRYAGTLESNAHLICAAPKMRDALQALLDWGREHTSPLDPNSPHQLLIDAAAALDGLSPIYKGE